MNVVCGFLMSPQWLCLHKSTCMAPSCSIASSLLSCDLHHMHATLSSCRDVLQGGVARGLHQYSSSHASVKLRTRIGVA